MEFFSKIFKALNSAQHPWQVTLSIVLGMIMGLTPLSGTQTLIVLFVVFLLNIHIGLVFASAALFAGIAYLFDPLMEQFGWTLLHLEGMKELYTSWYNNGFMRLSHFNYTLTMGAAVTSLVLALPLFFLLNFVISLYREKIAVTLNKNKWFAKLGIFKVSDKKEPVLRWWGAGLYVGVVGGLAALLLLVIDPFLKWGIEKGASKALKRDVRVASVTSHLFDGSIAINTLEVASDKENIDAFSIQNISFDIDTNALLFSKTHIENMQVKGMGFDTPATLKKVYGKSAYKAKIVQEQRAEAAKEKAAEDGIKMPSIDLPTPKELLAKSDLKSQKLYDEAKEELAQLEAKWQKVQKEKFSQAVLDQYKKDLKQMQSDAKSKDAKKLLALAKRVASYEKKLKAQKDELLGLQKEFQADQKRVTALMKAIKSAPQEDYKKLRVTYTLNSSGGINLFGLLFSQKIAGYLHQAQGYYNQVAPYLESDDEPKEEVVPRGKGRWVRFAEHIPSPDVVVRRAAISGTKESVSFEGVIRNISDNQSALGKPLTFVIDSNTARMKGLHIEGEDNRLADEVIDSVSYSSDALMMKQMNMNKMQISDARIAFDGHMTLVDGNRVRSKTDVAFYDAQIKLNDVGGKGAEIFNATLAEIHNFGANVDVSGEWKTPKVDVHSEIDKQLSKAFKKVMAKEIKKYQAELKSLLNTKAKEQLAKLSKQTGGLVDMGALLDEQTLSIEALEKKAKELTSSANTKKVAKEQAKKYLSDKKNQEKLKKLFKF